MTRLPGVVPRSSRSRRSPSIAAQKMQPRAALSATYAIRHGAQRTCTSRLVGVRGGPRLPVDAESQLLAHLEEGDALGVHVDERAGLRVAPLARLAVLHDEAAEAADLDALAAREGRGQAVEDGVHHDLRLAPREAREVLHHLVDEPALGHRGHPGSGPR